MSELKQIYMNDNKYTVPLAILRTFGKVQGGDIRPLCDALLEWKEQRLLVSEKDWEAVDRRKKDKIYIIDMIQSILAVYFCLLGSPRFDCVSRFLEIELR